WKGWAILLRQKQKKLIMLPSETMIWQPEFTDKTLSRKPGAVHSNNKHHHGMPTKTGAGLRFCEAVGLLHPANIFPRPVSTQNLQRS
ncbi:hypothetical protein OZH77_28960, partial [Escherichia coli]|nr:hypothetical protein [Escherichia coli]MCZ0334516.1 hypothetical protein [Escherichia coli]